MVRLDARTDPALVLVFPHPNLDYLKFRATVSP